MDDDKAAWDAIAESMSPAERAMAAEMAELSGAAEIARRRVAACPHPLGARDARAGEGGWWLTCSRCDGIRPGGTGPGEWIPDLHETTGV